MSLHERLKEFITYNDLTYKSFESACGLGNGTAKRFNESIRRSTLNSICATFPELNPEWLLTGEGEMLRPAPPAAPQKNQRQNLIPFYDAQTTGGFDGLVSLSSEESRVKGYVDAGSWFDGRATAAIRHVGDSMTEYPDGCILAVREVHDARLLVPGRVYVVETSEYRVTKRYQLGSDPDTIALYSSNNEKYEDGRLVYEPFEVNKADIRHMFLVLGYIVNQSGETRLINPLN